MIKALRTRLSFRLKPEPSLFLIVVFIHAVVFWLIVHAAQMTLSPPQLPLPVVMMASLISPSASEVSAPLLTRLTRPRPQPQAKPLKLEPAQPAEDVPAESASLPLAEAVQHADTQISAAVIPPRFNAAYLNNPPPVYPTNARRMGDEGRVLLRVYVSAEGTPSEVKLQGSSGTPSLDEAALTAVKSWRFIPAKQGDRPVAAWVQVPIDFQLK